MQTRIGPMIEVSKPATRFKITKSTIRLGYAYVLFYSLFALFAIFVFAKINVYFLQSDHSITIDIFGNKGGNPNYTDNMISAGNNFSGYLLAGYLGLIILIIVDAIYLNVIIGYICLVFSTLLTILALANISLLEMVTIQDSSLPFVTVDAKFGISMVAIGNISLFIGLLINTTRLRRLQNIT